MGSPIQLETAPLAQARKAKGPVRFTLDGNDQLESRLGKLCEEARQAVCSIIPASRLDGILLAGGYGRGEGGVLRSGAAEHPYNDLDFYVFTRGSPLLARRTFGRKLLELERRLSAAAGLDVELKISSLPRLRRSPVTMFSYDLVLGHRWLTGHDDLLQGCEHHRDPRLIPFSEAVRLLWNRSSGLLFSAERLGRPDFDAAGADFVGRNLAKAQLGFGDALLAAHGQYHWSCLERHRRLGHLLETELPEWAASIEPHHQAGVDFKLHPVRSEEPREVLAGRLRELSSLGRRLWLWLESRRLGRPFGSAGEYATSRVNKCPETCPLKNILVNLKAFGPGILLTRRASRYPRERLFQALALLLFEGEASLAGQTSALVQDELRFGAGSFPDLVEAYRQLWSCFN